MSPRSEVLRRSMSVGLVVFSLLLIAGCRSKPTGSFSPVIYRALDYEPAWSHDGNHIAFARTESTSIGPAGIYLMEYPGGTPRLLVPFWTPGLNRLAFAPDDRSLITGCFGVGIRLTIEDGKDEWLCETILRRCRPQLSRSGRRLAFVKQFGMGASAIALSDVPDRGGSVLYSGGAPARGTHPSWGPGDSVLAVGQNDGLALLRIDKGPRRLLTTSAPGEFHTAPRWLSDSTLVFDVVRLDRSLPPESFVLNLATGERTRIPGDLGGSEALSPRGDSILYAAPDGKTGGTARTVLFVRALTADPKTARQVTFQ